MEPQGEIKLGAVAEIPLEEIRKYYFEHSRRSLRIEDAKYLQERAAELGITSENGGVAALFSTLSYKFED